MQGYAAPVILDTNSNLVALPGRVRIDASLDLLESAYCRG